MKFDNTRILVEDFKVMFDFFSKDLGLKVAWGNKEGSFASFSFPEGGGIGIFEKQLMLNALGKPKQNSKSLSQVLVVSVESVDKFYENKVKQGVKFINQPIDMKDWGIRVVHLQDPEGNVFEFFSPLDPSKWSDKLREQTK